MIQTMAGLSLFRPGASLLSAQLNKGRLWTLLVSVILLPSLMSIGCRSTHLCDESALRAMTGGEVLDAAGRNTAYHQV